jgi:hypothetical protein
MVNPLQAAAFRPYEDDEERQSLLGRIGSTALSGLSRAANLLGVPGSMIQNALAFENPLAPLLHPTTNEGRVGGRGLLRKYGLIGQEDSTANWFAGFGADVLTDPLTFVGPGLLTKAASTGVKGLGAAGKVTKAAQSGGGLLSVGVPFMQSTTREVLTGPGSQGAADSLRKAAEYLGTSYPMRSALNVFDSAKMGKMTPEGQRIGEEIFDTQTHGGQQVRALTTDLARSIEKAGNAAPAGAAALRKEIEVGIPSGAPVSDEATKLADMFSTYRTKSEWAGLKSADLDDSIGYAMRQLNENLLDSKSSDSVFGPFSAASKKDTSRLQLLKGFKEGTADVNKLFADSALKGKVNTWNQQLEAARVAGQPKAALNQLRKQAQQDIEQHIGTNHGQSILTTYQPVNASGKKLWADATGKKIWSKTMPQGASAVMKDRHKGLASMALDSPKWFDHTPFPNNPVVDAEVYALSHENRIRAATTIYDNVAKLAKPGASSAAEDVPLSKIFKGLGLSAKTASQRVADAMGTNWSPQAGKDILSMRLPKDLADDLLATWPTYQVPKNTGLLLNSVDSMSALWKAGALTWPATLVRNATSGAIQNVMKGWVDLDSFVDAHKLAQGQTLKNLTGIREVRDWLHAKNLPVTDENATEAMRQIFAAHHAGGHATMDVVSGAMPNVDPGIESLLSRVPGRTPATMGESIAKVAQTAIGQSPDTNLNPLNVRGVNGKLKSTFGPAAASDMVNQYVDTLNRAAPLIYRMRNGESAAQAMKDIAEAQVDYSARAFTGEERSILKRVFPFYSFTKSQMYWVAKELLQNPGGRLRQTIRATASARGDDPTVPDYVGETAAIPLGESEDGTKRYVTGFGMMHEDPLSFFGGPQDAMLETLSRTNPLIKGPLEFATGQSFFQRGTEGGRPMRDLDPVLGRTLANVGNITGLRESTDPVRFPGSPIVEQIASNSPASRVFTTARTLTDTRKSALDKATNLLSGVRVSDISPSAQDNALMNRVNSLLKSSGAREFSSISIPKDRLDRLSPRDREMVEQLQEVKKLIAERRKQRRNEFQTAVK